ncbi:MAG: MBL fold metallo-hydrolase, partial [Bacillota bacterium]|nr:MBL fold metallo-hydrolase [Bacillota bacterium]
TDTGSITPSMKRMLSNIEGLVFEANYCADMLRCGPYPQFLKQRILSSHGHLSNRQSGQALAALLGERSQAVLLAHLSHTNNEPERAMKQVCEELQGCPHMEHVHISVAPRSTAHPLIELY